MKTLLFASGNSASFVPRRPLLLSSGQDLREWLVILHRCNPVLSWAGWLSAGLALLALALVPFDERVVTGLNVWFKPLKFSLSNLIYLWTLGWLLADLPAPAQRAVRLISWGVAISMTVEIAAIFLQAARGTTSHFNNSSVFDALVFAAMGLFIAINTLLLVWALYLMLRHRPFGSAGYVWGMRLGLLLFLLGSAIGGAMIGQNAHTVGAPDGGAGLPVLGWSTRAGDLRAAHFLGLHALQALPLAGWLLARAMPSWKTGAQTAGIFAFAALYAGGVALLYWRALSGLPLLSQ
ncbi:hypothetical protein GCM10011375_37090 [Hymenobacter qilianensis]|uniref:Uncharacterized protein n=2 Tax=Hymenobacter qilianensis TaxID=1385715 RepID=A0ACB5PWD1_9BACT|nr:hypothetical protein [Hymenobacter qilianensis]QNP51076.1 hypothetical protein H9L05_13240 [Hymenobacter qilianensis]GGF78573.1 hypothetical protein GCM10011375_37090 [Hymenobacter qilianensis]